MSELESFYAKLDAALPETCKVFINGRPMILSSMAYGKPYRPESRDEWLSSVESRIVAGLSCPPPMKEAE